MKTTLFSLLLSVMCVNAISQHVDFTDINPFYAQNFNSLPSGSIEIISDSWTDGSTINGWYAKTTATIPPEPNIYYHFNVSDTWMTDSTILTKGQGLSNLGLNFDSDRSFGAWVNSKTGHVYYGVKIRNNTSSEITSITVKYDGEQWMAVGSTTEDLLFSYKVNATDIAETEGWTEVAQLKFTTLSNPATPRKNAGINGKDPNNRRANITGEIPVRVPVGEYLWLRWFDQNNTGKAGNAVLAIDNLEVDISNNPTTINNIEKDDSNYLYIDLIAKKIKINPLLQMKSSYVYTIDGRLLIACSEQQSNIDLSKLKCGNYIIKVVTESRVLSRIITI